MSILLLQANPDHTSSFSYVMCDSIHLQGMNARISVREDDSIVVCWRSGTEKLHLVLRGDNNVECLSDKNVSEVTGPIEVLGVLTRVTIGGTCILLHDHIARRTHGILVFKDPDNFDSKGLVIRAFRDACQGPFKFYESALSPPPYNRQELNRALEAWLTKPSNLEDQAPKVVSTLKSAWETSRA